MEIVIRVNDSVVHFMVKAWNISDVLHVPKYCVTFVTNRYLVEFTKE